MNIYAVKGHKIKYTGCSDSQVQYGSHDDPRGILKEGDVYVVDHTVVHNFCTEIYLEGHEDKNFNSVCFDDA